MTAREPRPNPDAVTPTLLLAATTVATREQARELARRAVQQGLAACVHLQPIQSIYSWRGEVHEDSEWRLLFKTTGAAWPELERALLASHPYEDPVVYAVQPQLASAGTLAWWQQAVQPR